MEFAQSAPAASQRIGDAQGVSLILILSDIMRPVPIIIITAYGDDETKRRALSGGAEGLLTKPIGFAALRTDIDTRIEQAA
jgi:CheY-like chemotaxis protein